MQKDHKPWKPVPYEPADVSAIQLLSRGECPPELQQRAFKWLIEKACATYDQSFYPGEEGRRDSDFAEGRRFVGNTLIKMTRLNVSKLTEETK